MAKNDLKQKDDKYYLENNISPCCHARLIKSIEYIEGGWGLGLVRTDVKICSECKEVIVSG